MLLASRVTRWALPIVAALGLAVPPAAQGITYDVGYALTGNGWDYSGLTDGEGFVLGTHQAIGLQIPLVRSQTAIGSAEVGVRTAWVRIAYDDPEPGADSTASFPGIYGYWLSDLTSPGSAVGLSATAQLGYDVYNAEGALVLAWVPHVAGGFGPIFRFGPVHARAHAMGQLSSALQGVGVYLRFEASLGL